MLHAVADEVQKHRDIASYSLSVPSASLLLTDLDTLWNGAAAEVSFGLDHLVHTMDLIIENGLVVAVVQSE